jgi:arylsulfatase A-like enzyme
MASVCGFQPPVTAAQPPPNVVLVMCDDLGWGDVGFNGNKVIRTPHLDEMARAGLTLTRFYAASAVCSPTRGSVITGRHPYRYGVTTANRGHMKQPEATLAELLHAKGYATGHFGKWHLGTLTTEVVESNRGGPRGAKDFSPPWRNGFDVCFSTEAKTPTFDPMWKPRGRASRNGWDYIADKTQAARYGTHYWNQRGEMVDDNLAGDDSRVIMDRAVPFIEKCGAERRPFFAVIWFHTPHLPVVAGPRHAAMYAKYDSYAKNYYGCITAMDEQIGRLRAVLKKAGVAENTLLTFCSDNGPEGKSTAPGSAGPFRGRKRDLFEGGVRVPGLIEWPAVVKGGKRTDYPAVTSDYLPTVLELVGAELDDDRPIDGVSLLPVLRNNIRERPRPIGFQFGGKMAWNDNRYKLVYYPKAAKAGNKNRNNNRNRKPASAATGYMLFDLIDDPSEKNDLADEQPERVATMKKALLAWQASCAASDAGGDYSN